MEKIQKSSFITLLVKKIQSKKKFDITFSQKRSLHKFRKINETMNPIIGLGHAKKDQEVFLKKNEVFLAEKRRCNT